MPTQAAAPYVLDPDYQPTDEDQQLIDSICAHVREHPKLYESAVRELDCGKFSFKSLAADRADFEAAAKKDDARAKKVARKKGQPTHRSWLKQNAPDPRRAIDWRDMRRRRPEVVDLLRINAVRDELLMNWSGLPGSWRGPASADRLAISTLKSQVIFVMTSVLFDPDDHDGQDRASLQKVPWNGPPLAGRRGAQRVIAERGELKNWIAMARRAASKLKSTASDEVNSRSVDKQRPTTLIEVESAPNDVAGVERSDDAAIQAVAAVGRSVEHQSALPHHPRGRRQRAEAPADWIYLNDAASRFSIRRSRLHDFTCDFSTEDRVKGADSGQVRVRLTALLDVLRRKDRVSR